MKLTKKILSLVLAAALVLGTIAVAANAADYDGLAYEGSKLTYTVTADKTEVKPGETVTFSVYMTTNYYTGSAGGLFAIWNAGVFEALDANYSIKNFGATFKNTVTSPARTAAYPAGYAAADYVAFQAIHQLEAGVTVPAMLDNVLVYTFTFTVLETATPGTEVTFEIPAGAVKSAALPGMKGMTYMGIGSSSSNPTNTKAYAETTDVSAASVTITVASAAVLGEIVDVTGYPIRVGDTAIATVEVTGAPESLRIVAPSGETTYARDDFSVTIEATEGGEIWSVAVPVTEEGENACTVYADYGEAGETEGYAFTITGIGLCDYDALEAAVAKTPEKAEEYYDAEAYKAWADAKAEGQALLDADKLYNVDDNQKTIDDAAALIESTFAALEPSYLSLDKLNAAVDACDEIDPADKDYYVAEDYDAWQTALAAAKDAQGKYTTDDPATKQAEVDAIADTLTQAYGKLKAAYVDASAIAEAITAYGTTEYTAEYYDEAEYKAYEAALAAANDADFEGKPDTQANRDAVAKIADDLKVAYEALDARFVDASAIADAITAYGTTEYTSEYYDADEYNAYTAALAAANDADFEGKPDTQANRDAVAKIADDLKVAYEALDARFVDYAKLEAAVDTYGEAPEAEFYYTPDSWAAYQDALAAAVDANTNRPQPLPAASEENQAAVDAYADALEKAYNELTPGECHVISVTPLQENYVVNNWINFAVLVEGTPAKIQLVKANGVTSTYSPDTPQVVSITDNGDGTQTWIINRRVFEEEYTEYAKAKMGRNWDTGVVPYDVKCTVEDAEVKSVEVTLDGEVVDTVLRTDFPTVTIVTGPATKKIRLLDPVTGGSLTYAEPASVNADGTKVWVIVKQYYQVKQYDLDIMFLGSKGTYVDSGLDLEINVVDVRESQLPSTDSAEDAIYSAEVAKTRILKGSTQTFTYTTDKDCKAVRILNADGSVFRTIKASASVEEGVATWVYECVYNSLGERSYKAEALYGETWIADEDSAVSFNIAY